MAEINIVSSKTNFKDFAFLKIEACKLLYMVSYNSYRFPLYFPDNFTFSTKDD